MNYGIAKVARIAGISIRTLRFYDEIGLLKPAYTTPSGYRYYQEQQLLVLQQILFFRELGFELKQIQTIIDQDKLDTIEILKSHKKVIKQRIMRLNTLLKTIDKTVQHVEEGMPIGGSELFDGLHEMEQPKYEEYLKKKLLPQEHHVIEESKEKIKSWTKDQWDACKQEMDSIHKDLARALKQRQSPEAEEVQALIGRHYLLVTLFWTPSRESYEALGTLYTEHRDFKKYYARYHKDLANYLHDAMKIYAHKNLE